jgi:hypothetical protein
MKNLIDFTDQKIENAVTARANSKSDWAKQYWDNVLAYLLRQANRLN